MQHWHGGYYMILYIQVKWPCLMRVYQSVAKYDKIQQITTKWRVVPVVFITHWDLYEMVVIQTTFHILLYK